MDLKEPLQNISRFSVERRPKGGCHCRRSTAFGDRFGCSFGMLTFDALNGRMIWPYDQRCGHSTVTQNDLSGKIKANRMKPKEVEWNRLDTAPNGEELLMATSSDIAESLIDIEHRASLKSFHRNFRTFDSKVIERARLRACTSDFLLNFRIKKQLR